MTDAITLPPNAVAFTDEQGRLTVAGRAALERAFREVKQQVTGLSDVVSAIANVEGNVASILETKVDKSLLVTGAASIDSGGVTNLSQNRVFQLVNDQDSPAEGSVYGTDPAGEKGWVSLDFVTVGNATTLNGQAAAYYLDWTNFTNTPTTLAGYGVTQIDLPEIAEPAAPAANTATLYVTDSNGITELELKDATGLVHRIGEELLVRVRNTSGADMDIGEAVYITGSTGGTPNVSLARANASATTPCAGLVVEAIPNNGFGRVILNGVLEGFDTSAFTEGDEVWLSAAVAGDLTNTAPTSPDLIQRIGVITNSGAGNGSILVNIDPVASSSSLSPGTTAQFLRGDLAWSNNIVGPLLVGASGAGSAIHIGFGTANNAGNTVIGLGAQGAGTIGNRGTFIGNNAAAVATGGNDCVAVGYRAMGGGINTGAQNTAVGSDSLRVNTSGSSNCAFGYKALDKNTTGALNMSLGASSMLANTTGSSNSAVGFGALQSNTTGGFNMALGRNALSLNVGGARNVGVGYQAGTTPTSANANVSGNNNTYVGSDSGPGTTTQLDYACVIGSGATVTTGSTVVLGRAATDFTVIGATGNSGGGCKLQVTGHIGVLGAGNGLRVAEGSNAKQGVATLVAGAVTVANTSVGANSRIFLTIQDPNGGTPGAVYVASRINGTSFTINSTNAGDTSIVAYEIFEPGT